MPRAEDYPGPAIACVLGAVFLFSVYNALAKGLSDSFPAGEIFFFRSVFGLPPVAAAWVMAPHGRGIGTAAPRAQVLRGSAAVGASLCFIAAYETMPLANAVAICYSAPVIIAALSPLLLSERVTAHRFAAIAAGFLGVALISGPGPGVIRPGAAYALAGATLYAVAMVATRRLGRVDDVRTTAFLSTNIYVAVSLPFAALAWHQPTITDWPSLIALGAVGGPALLLSVCAYRLAPAVLVAPYDYTALLWAAFWGAMIWDEMPDPVSLAGMGLIGGAGVYLARATT